MTAQSEIETASPADLRSEESSPLYLAPEEMKRLLTTTGDWASDYIERLPGEPLRRAHPLTEKDLAGAEAREQQAHAASPA